jgi:hypothetical protein
LLKALSENLVDTPVSPLAFGSFLVTVAGRNFTTCGTNQLAAKGSGIIRNEGADCLGICRLACQAFEKFGAEHACQNRAMFVGVAA